MRHFCSIPMIIIQFKVTEVNSVEQVCALAKFLSSDVTFLLRPYSIFFANVRLLKAYLILSLPVVNFIFDMSLDQKLH